MTRVIGSHTGVILLWKKGEPEAHRGCAEGVFSRYDYDRWIDSGISSIHSFKTILPASAQDVYYRDEIGSIYTRQLLILDDSVEMWK